MKKKINFKNDYGNGCHHSILKALADSNDSVTEGYGDDMYSLKAKQLIRQEIQNPDAAIHFVSGGTQANALIIASLLKPFESVIAAETGHINIHEAAAIEATGHKIDIIPTPDGKLNPSLVQEVLQRHEDHHTARPKLVYISNTTEVGTCYNALELKTLYEFCTKKGLLLMLDGARLGAALVSISSLTLQDVATYTDVFYIGGTKNGALLGEAIVFPNPILGTDFLYHIKQRGALLAKGRLLGLQFQALFTNGTYYHLAQHGFEMAMQVAKGIQERGYTFLHPSASNQIFPIFPISLIEKLQQEFDFYTWKPVTNDTASVRLVTSWSTSQEDVEAFLACLESS